MAASTATYASAAGPGTAALYAAYWSGGRDIGRIDVLMEIAAGLDMDPTDLKIALDKAVYADGRVVVAKMVGDLEITTDNVATLGDLSDGLVLTAESITAVCGDVTTAGENSIGRVTAAS